jgi:hypothetical protein
MITISEFSVPEDVSLEYRVDSTGINDFTGIIMMDTLKILAQDIFCVFDVEITNLGFQFSGVSEFDSAEFRVYRNEPEIFEPLVNVTGTGEAFCPLLANLLKDIIAEEVNKYLFELAMMFNAISFEELFVFLNPVKAMDIEDPELIAAAMESFPMDMDMYTAEDTKQGVIQLIIKIDFLMGTTFDSTAFVGIEPELVSDSQLEIGGFSFLYWVLQRGFPWHTEWDEARRVDATFEIMNQYEINGYRIETRWSDVQIKAYLGDELDPADITPDLIDGFLAQGDYWDLGGLYNVQDILENGSSRGLKPLMALGVGHQDRMPVDENGLRIAPASDEWEAPDGYVGVSAKEYLYNLKIFALATVRKFAAFVNVWQVENELNAAGFAAANPDWWRKGDLWMDAAFRDSVWSVIVAAINSEDPAALITHNFHMLGFMQSLQSWLDDLDIVGFDFYPNQNAALPVLGFGVGEYVWAVRRALTGLNAQDKPVWLIETGYPGIEIDDPPDSILLAADYSYFSEKRQQEYIETALSLAVKNGVNGFFYYSLTTQEDSAGSGPQSNQPMRFSGMIRRDSDESKIALAAYADLYNQLVVETELQYRKTSLPQSYVLHQNFPNPFNPMTVISYQLAVGSDVELSIYNTLGQKIAILVSEKQPAGTYTVEWDASGLASGIYYYRLDAGNFQDMKKMVLLK